MIRPGWVLNRVPSVAYRDATNSATGAGYISKAIRGDIWYQGAGTSFPMSNFVKNVKVICPLWEIYA